MGRNPDEVGWFRRQIEQEYALYFSKTIFFEPVLIPSVTR